MRLLVGIDDTDNLESRGTGHGARQLAAALDEAGFRALGVTRHQLLVDPRIPYTSHNSSACIEIDGDGAAAPRVAVLVREFLAATSASGSDAGFAVAAVDAAAPAKAFGARAKREVITAADAHAIAEGAGIHLEGVTGARIGVIGALAAVGLRAGGNDGRFLWRPGLRDLSGIVTAADVVRDAADELRTEAGERPAAGERVDVGEWARPLLVDGRAVLLVERVARDDCQWVVAAKDRIKALSS